jgi:hypothetical protein
LIPYASRTGTLRNLDALRRRKWRLLISATGEWRTEGFPYALDNGAYTAWQEWKAGKRAENLLDLDLFVGLVRLLGPGADFIVLPDIVGEGAKSLALSTEWAPHVRAMPRMECVPLYLAVQDGMDQGELYERVCELAESGAIQGIFVGGETAWKESTVLFWGQFKRLYGLKLHVARVNTTRRVFLCIAADADSIDGTSATVFSVTLPKLDGAIRHRDFFAGEGI